MGTVRAIRSCDDGLLEVKDEAEAGLEGPGVLLDGEVVLTEVGCFKEGLLMCGMAASPAKSALSFD